MTDARRYAVWPDPRSRSKSRWTKACVCLWWSEISGCNQPILLAYTPSVNFWINRLHFVELVITIMKPGDSVLCFQVCRQLLGWHCHRQRKVHGFRRARRPTQGCGKPHWAFHQQHRLCWRRRQSDGRSYFSLWVARVERRTRQSGYDSGCLVDLPSYSF